MESKFSPKFIIPKRAFKEVGWNHNWYIWPEGSSQFENSFMHEDWQLSISMAEHESLLQAERDRALELERRLAVATKALEKIEKPSVFVQQETMLEEDNESLVWERAARERRLIAADALDELTKPSTPHKEEK